MRTVYMAVSPDRYELPIAVRDTAAELGKLFGISRTTVLSNIADGRSGVRRGAKFVKTYIEEGEN